MQENFIVRSDYTAIGPKLRETLRDFHKIGKNVTRGERNEIKKVAIDGIVFNIKKFKSPNFFQALIYRFFRKSKAQRSFDFAEKLNILGIGTPLPVAFLERFSFGLRESFYVSLHLDYDFDFRELIHNPKFPERVEILKQFTAFTFLLHENCVNFLDHSPGNTLIVNKGNGIFDFYLIDLNRMRFETLDFEERMHNFRRLWLSKTMIKIMAVEYAKLYGSAENESVLMMQKYSKIFQNKKNRRKLRRRKGNY